VALGVAGVVVEGEQGHEVQGAVAVGLEQGPQLVTVGVGAPQPVTRQLLDQGVDPLGVHDRTPVMRASGMAFTTIEVEAAGERGAVWLARPDKLNPLGTDTLHELAEAARWFDARPEVKVVVVGGRGRAFSAGADVGAFTGPDPGVAAQRAAADAGRLMAEAIEAMAAVTVARIHGHCVGGGVVLAAACDLRVAAAGTRFSIPEVDLGIPLAWGGIPRLVREIGPAMTRELVLTCRPFDAEEARSLGFVNRVVDDAELDHAVDELVGGLVAKSSLTLRATKAGVAAALDELLPASGAWSDADTLLTALRDPESRQAALRYLDGLRRGR
jgi:enoyl-CoA hydratase/carnithine racemase